MGFCKRTPQSYVLIRIIKIDCISMIYVYLHNSEIILRHSGLTRYSETFRLYRKVVRVGAIF